VWIASGTYVPVDRPNGGNEADNRTKHFSLRNNVAVYGGFAGTETSLGERDLLANETILSGDFNGNDVYDADSGQCLSGNGENATIVFNHPSGMVVLDNTATLNDVTIRGGSGNYGGGMNNASASKPVLNRCVFSGNRATYSGGAVNNSQGAAPVLRDCVFRGNITGTDLVSGNAGGGAVYEGTNTGSVYENCTFYRNGTAVNGGGMNLAGGATTLSNCTFYRNTARSSGGGVHVQTGSSVTLVNCTIVENSAASNSGIYASGSNKQLINCIVWGNMVSSGLAASHCIVQGGYEGTGNIDADPLLLVQRDYNNTPTVLHILGGSPAIDSGMTQVEAPEGVTIPASDYRGITRSSMRPTIGAYEWRQTAVAIDSQPQASGETPVKGSTVTISANTNNGVRYEWYYKRNESVDYSLVGETATPSWSFNAGADTYGWYVMVAYDADGNPQPAEVVKVRSPRVYVSTTGSDENDGSSWATAVASVQHAINNCFDNEVWIASGTYVPVDRPNGGNEADNRTKHFSLRNNVAVYGGFAGTETSLGER
ncbi:hypothetical protein M2447_002802, partial [Ereboglobus sp. PH5-10]|uniref:right-handed parallel beta-helix repeat-containing protein n=1 Tax=Ereboglobus sp. PH5-10 TaxID=2940629 RepID=UPI002404E477